jgi:hypothetical protein
MSLSTTHSWICWGKPNEPICLCKWQYSHRSAVAWYGRNMNFYGKRYAIRLDEWQAMVTRSLELIQAEVEVPF